jgi:hypothetical protein
VNKNNELQETINFISSISEMRFKNTHNAIKFMIKKSDKIKYCDSKIAIYVAISEDYCLISDYKNSRKYCMMAIMLSKKDPVIIGKLSDLYNISEENFKSYLICKIALSKARKEGNFVRQMTFSLIRSILSCKRYDEIENLIDFVINYVPPRGSIDVGYERDFIGEMKRVPLLEELAEKYERVAVG